MKNLLNETLPGIGSQKENDGFLHSQLKTIYKINQLRKISSLTGFLLFLLTCLLEYSFIEEYTLLNIFLRMILPSFFFIAGIYTTFHSSKRKYSYITVAATAPAAGLAGIYSMAVFKGELLYIYPLGIAFVILWLYINGISFYNAMPLNCFIILAYILSDVLFFHYQWEFRIFYYLFLLSISLIGFVSTVLLQQSLQELKEKHDHAVESSRKLEKEFQNNTVIYTSLAHEIKTPLTLIRHYFSSYRMQNKDSMELQVLQDNFDKLERQIVNFLKIERELLLKDVVIFKDEKSSCCLSHIIIKNLPLLKSYFSNKGISLSAEIHDRITVPLSLSDCEHVILNLLENAYKYTNKGGQVWISLMTGEKGQALLKVADNGIGIKPGEIHTIFGQYTQGNLGRSAKQGLGMGLAIVKSIVNREGGDIQVESQIGKGAEFTVRLPQTDALQDHEVSGMSLPFNFPKQQTTNEPTAKDQNRQGKNKLLILEDNDDLRIFLQNYLSEDYTVTAFENGQKAISNLCEDNLPDLVISDIYMDEVNGIDFLEYYRNRFSDSSIPFIFISADDTEQMRLEGLKKGALDYVVKPFNPLELKIKISSWLFLLSNLHEDEKKILNNLVSDYALTTRENQITMLMLKGLSRKHISEKLYISPNTVKTHIASIYVKCSVKTKDDLILKLKGQKMNC